MNRDFIEKWFGGNVIDFGACYVGKNLNLHVLRGFATLDKLAVISAPDVFDQEENPTGTQRELSREHARACRDYALTADAEAPEEKPRFFPEILLNVRDLGVIELYNIEDPEEYYEFDSFSDDGEVPRPLVGLRVLLSALEFPKPTKSPHISRVDGNHRLWGIDEQLETASSGNGGDEVPEFPTVTYSMLIGLDPTQEARLFRDINGEHKGMDVTHLDQIVVRTTPPEVLKANPKTVPLWLADQLAEPGRAFEGMVFRGGAKEGLKKIGEQRPVKLNALKTMIAQQLKAAEKVNALLGDKPDALLELLDRYWQAVRETFPEAWHDRRGYILLQAIGLGGFAKLGGSILDTAFDEQSVQKEDFKKYLAPLRDKISLKREDWIGIAGAGGAQRVADELLKASDADAVKAGIVTEKLLGTESIDAKLGLSNKETS